MNTEYKLVALDIDGTLLPSFHSKLTPRLRDALRASSESMNLALITGRSYEDVQPLLADLCMPHIWLGLGGGGEVRSPDGEVLVQSAFNEHEFQLLEEFLDRRGGIMVLQSQRWVQVSARDPNQAVLALYVGGLRPEQARDLQWLAASQFPHMYISEVTDPDSEDHRTVFFQPRTATKGAALQEIQSRLGVGSEQTASAGDMSLDIPMFENSGLSAAMGNAPDEVKAHASVVLPNVQDEGVIALLEMISRGEMA